MLVYGVIIAAIATGIGIIITVKDRKNENTKRIQEIMQIYSEEIRAIQDQERVLKTQLDCVLYAEQYLDTLEKIATLKEQGTFSDDAMKYFENNFIYGIHLWFWYNKYVHHLQNDTILEFLWQTKPNSSISLTSTEIDLVNAIPEISQFNTEEKTRAIENYISQDRWPEFRIVCNSQKIPWTRYEFNFTEIGGHGNEPENWRILPDLMYYNYDDIPSEDGLSKAELVEIIRPYANDLSTFVEKEKEMSKPEDFEIYAEQYLETLEQIATLYENKIIPTKASEYFENKFSYGCNLWDWYYGRVLKFSPNFYQSLWKMKSVVNINKLIKGGKTTKEQSTNDLFTKFLEDYLGTNTYFPDDLAQVFLTEDPDVLKFVAKISIKDEIMRLRHNRPAGVTDDKLEELVKRGIDTFVRDNVPKDSNVIMELLKSFVIDFSSSERWRDFKWWCHENTITSFEEDPEEGLILPLKMWQAQYR